MVDQKAGTPEGEALSNDDIGLETRIDMFRLQVEIRDCEKRAHDLFLQNLIKGTSHLSLGQEAIAAAERLEQDLRSPFAPTVVADLWLRLDDLDRAMDWLERAYDSKFFRVAWIGADASYRKLYGHPRFEALRAKLLAGVTRR